MDWKSCDNRNCKCKHFVDYVLTVKRKLNKLSVFTRNLVSTICSRQHHLLALQHLLRQSSVPIFVERKIPRTLIFLVAFLVTWNRV